MIILEVFTFCRIPLNWAADPCIEAFFMNKLQRPFTNTRRYLNTLIVKAYSASFLWIALQSLIRVHQQNYLYYWLYCDTIIKVLTGIRRNEKK